MKKYISLIAILFTMSFILSACGNGNVQNEISDNREDNHTEDKQNSADEHNDESEKENVADATVDSGESETDNNKSDEKSSYDDEDEVNNHSEDKESSVLSEYSVEEIEYARVWLHLGKNQDIDELYAEQLPAGEPLNSDDGTSLDYPEDVVQLSGTRLVDGAVTYSSNGDGTINVYNVPKRWDGKNPAGEDVYMKIIDHTEQVSIDPGQNEKVEELIKKLTF